MSTFRGRSSHFTRVQVLQFMRNGVKNHVGEVADEDFFLPIASLMSATENAALIRRGFPPRKVLALEKCCRGRYRLEWDDENEEILQAVWNAVSCRRRLVELLIRKIDCKLSRFTRFNLERDRFKLRLDELQKTLHLSDLERDVLLLSFFIANAQMHPYYKEYVRKNNLNNRIVFYAQCLDRPISEVSRAVEAQGRLQRYGCLDAELAFNKDFDGFLYDVDNAPLSTHFYRQCTDVPLPWSYYGTLAERHGEILKTLLASRNSKRGMNILLYGAPGTGKTSFGHSLAAELGLACYDIAQDTNRKGDATRSNPMHRFAALQICDSQVDATRSLLVVDEADDMLRSRRGYGMSSFLDSESVSTGDKGMLNSVLDGIKTPCIWITNTDADSLDPSSRRRFDYSIRFEKLNSTQRIAIWRNNVKTLKLARLLSEPLIEKLAEKYETSAGGISLVLKNTADMKPSPSECEGLIDKLMQPHCELLGIKTDNKFAVSKDYTLEGLNIKGDIPLNKIVEAVRAFQSHKTGDFDRPRMNLLLSGPPGSGKTEFVKHLGEVLKTKVIVKTGSDILSMWVGGTEKNIREAFVAAENEKAILFIDEIDGLMQTRERAQRSWEVTQVNELLQCMERFDGILIAATNFSENLDPASVRRFTFKLVFDYLNREGKICFFRKMFQSELTDDEAERLSRIPDLTPGDFRTVRQSLYYLGGNATNAERIDALKSESMAKVQSKGQGSGNLIGFSHAHG